MNLLRAAHGFCIKVLYGSGAFSEMRLTQDGTLGLRHGNAGVQIIRKLAAIPRINVILHGGILNLQYRPCHRVEDRRIQRSETQFVDKAGIRPKICCDVRVWFATGIVSFSTAGTRGPRVRTARRAVPTFSLTRQVNEAKIETFVG